MKKVLSYLTEKAVFVPFVLLLLCGVVTGCSEDTNEDLLSNRDVFDSHKDNHQHIAFSTYESEVQAIIPFAEHSVDSILNDNPSIDDQRTITNLVINELISEGHSGLWTSNEFDFFTEYNPVTYQNDLDNLLIQVDEIHYLSEITRNYIVSLADAFKTNDVQALVTLLNNYRTDYGMTQDLESLSYVFAVISFYEDEFSAGSNTKARCQIDGATVAAGAFFSGIAGGIKGAIGGSVLGLPGTIGGFVGGFLGGAVAGAIGGIGAQGVACELRNG